MSAKQAVVVFPSYGNKRLEQIALGHVTMFKGPFKHLSAPFLNGIGGKVKKGESPEETAVREFKEEVLANNQVIDSLDDLGDLILLGLVRYTFFPKEKTESECDDVHLYVFKLKLRKKISFSPNPKKPEFKSIDWYDRILISNDQIGPSHSSILPSDKIWLPHFLLSESSMEATLQITDQFKIWQGGDSGTNIIKKL